MVVSFGIKLGIIWLPINKIKIQCISLDLNKQVGRAISIGILGQNTININTLKCTFIQIRIQIYFFQRNKHTEHLILIIT